MDFLKYKMIVFIYKISIIHSHELTRDVFISKFDIDNINSRFGWFERDET